MLERVAECVNRLENFCGMRDIPDLTVSELERGYGIRQADLMVLFGGSILCGGDVLASAMKRRLARHYVIVGGAGHTTETLRQKMRALFSNLETEGLTEAELFDVYLRRRHGLHADFLERDSTNCGNNITCLLELVKRNRLPLRSVILSQDASMQRRMDAGLRKYAPDVKIINFASYRANVVVRHGVLAYEEEIFGM